MNNNRYKILLVEDEENIRALVSTLLDANGYQVILAASLAEAKTMYFSHIPDLVVLDLGLPDNDGSALVELIREKDLTPIIVLSARSGESEKVRLLDLGANDFVTKPFGSAELLARVRTSLRNYRHSSAEGRLPGGKFTLMDMVIDYDARRLFIGNDHAAADSADVIVLDPDADGSETACVVRARG